MWEVEKEALIPQHCYQVLRPGRHTQEVGPWVRKALLGSALLVETCVVSLTTPSQPPVTHLGGCHSSVVQGGSDSTA